MLHNQNLMLTLLFILITIVAMWLIMRACNYSKAFVISLIVWLIAQGILGYTGFYTKTNGLPPRFMLMLLPPAASIIILFSTVGGRRWLDNFDIVKSTWVHIVRIPVEIGLFWLFTSKLVPKMMTFEGGNLDIISGISAPFIAMMIKRRNIKRSWAIAWNLFCLCLLFNVVIHGILSVPSPFQQMSFDQPNIAILYFPFIWLPSVIVPVVLLAHLVSLRKLFQRNTNAVEYQTTTEITL
jgi:hypothetical protein